MKYLLAILMSFCVVTTTSAAWLQKPVLCGPTPQIVQDFNQDNYIPIARSVIRDNEDGKILGTLLFLIKDTELFIIENFFVTNISCIISLTTDFTFIKSKGGSSF